MYEESAHGESYTKDYFIAGVKNFIEAAVAKGFLASDNTIRCPCTKCKNRRFINIRMMEAHLYIYGFTPNYFNWTLHGEDLVEMEYVNLSQNMPQPITVDPVLESEDEYSNHDHAAFPDHVHEFANPAYEGCTTDTELSINMKMQQQKLTMDYLKAHLTPYVAP
ncbi:unnamed protein product [Rhodiola kirilowii]